jgi:hypothetical protein
MTLTPARLMVVLFIIGAGVFIYFQFRSDWVEVDERNFPHRVLQASVPALVYFDTAIGCRGGDGVFRTLSRQRRGVLDVFYVNSIAHPELARAYGVQHDVVFVLFERGRVVKRATAPELQASAMTKNNGLYSDETFLAEMEIFANLRPQAGFLETGPHRVALSRRARGSRRPSASPRPSPRRSAASSSVTVRGARRQQSGGGYAEALRRAARESSVLSSGNRAYVAASS